MVRPVVVLTCLVVGLGLALPSERRTLVDLHLEDDQVRSGWEVPPGLGNAEKKPEPRLRRRHVNKRKLNLGKIDRKRSRGPRLHRLDIEDDIEVQRGRRDISRLGRTGYGYTRDSLEDESVWGRRLGGPRRRLELRGRDQMTLKQGRGRIVPQILPLEEIESEETYDDEYNYEDEYGDEYENEYGPGYDDYEETEEYLVWPQEVSPSRSQNSRSELEVEGRSHFPVPTQPRTIQPTQPSTPRWRVQTPEPRNIVQPTNLPTTNRRVPNRRAPPTNTPSPRTTVQPTNPPYIGLGVAQGEEYRRGTEDEGGDEGGDEGECGPMCRNLVHEVGHPKEDARCPEEGMVIDIWGYCRHIFHEERRDWNWWRNVRQYVHANANSGANIYRPNIEEHAPWPGTWHSG